MSQIILEMSLACLEEKRIDRKENEDLFCIKSGNKYFWILMLYVHQMLSQMWIKTKTR